MTDHLISTHTHTQTFTLFYSFSFYHIVELKHFYECVVVQWKTNYRNINQAGHTHMHTHFSPLCVCFFSPHSLVCVFSNCLHAEHFPSCSLCVLHILNFLPVFFFSLTGVFMRFLL